MTLAESPLVYSCSGCSDAAQLANALALRADREGWAKMSCIAGVGGGVKPLVAQARKARAIVAIDGCALDCCVACLVHAGVAPTEHVRLAGHGVRKRRHADFDPAELDRLAPAIAAACERAASRAREPAGAAG